MILLVKMIFKIFHFLKILKKGPKTLKKRAKNITKSDHFPYTFENPDYLLTNFGEIFQKLNS